jgi:AraC-like DNA-binding protein
LAPFVRMYRAYRYSGFEPSLHLGLPSGDLTFIVNLGAQTQIVGMPGDQSPGSFDAFVGGLHARPAVVADPGHCAGISIDVSPLSARALFGLPAGVLAGSVVALTDLVGPAGDELVDRLRSASSWPACFRVLDDVLLRLVTDCDGPASAAAWAWRCLVRSGGRMRIGDLAADVGCSRRHLGSFFQAEFGVAPKTAARILRFERTGALLDRGAGLAEAAFEGGYYDQAHLTNEWRELAGATPLTWLTDELRDRLDHEPAER